MSTRIGNTLVALLVSVVWGGFALAECNPDMALTKPATRYLTHQDGTVTDTVTGLMWRTCPEGMNSVVTSCDSGVAATFNWQQALQHVAEVNAANNTEQGSYSDWRLPELKELKSLTELACYNPAINTDYFPNTPAGFFWSATAVTSAEGNIWSVGFFYGGDRWSNKEDARYVRLVRTAK